MNLANKLTLLRIALIPVMLALFYLPYPYMASAAAGVFILAGITDIKEGYVARKQKTVSDFGKIMDPIADKLITLAALCVLLEKGYVAAWAVIIIVGRELLIGGVRLVALARKGDVISASWLGKLKTVFQDAAIALLLFSRDMPFFNAWYLCDIFLYIALVFTLWSTVDYCLGAYRARKA